MRKRNVTDKILDRMQKFTKDVEAGNTSSCVTTTMKTAGDVTIGIREGKTVAIHYGELLMLMPVAEARARAKMITEMTKRHQRGDM